jgi:hypothetical protein
MPAYDKQYCELSPAVHDLVSALNAGHSELADLNGKFNVECLRCEPEDKFGSPHAYAMELRNLMLSTADTIVPLNIDTELLIALCKQTANLSRLRLLTDKEAEVVNGSDAITFLSSVRSRINYA